MINFSRKLRECLSIGRKGKAIRRMVTRASPSGPLKPIINTLRREAHLDASLINDPSLCIRSSTRRKTKKRAKKRRAGETRNRNWSTMSRNYDKDVSVGTGLIKKKWKNDVFDLPVNSAETTHRAMQLFFRETRNGAKKNERCRKKWLKKYYGANIEL